MCCVVAHRSPSGYILETTSLIYATPVAVEADRESQFLHLQQDLVVVNHYLLRFTSYHARVLSGIDYFTVLADHVWDMAHHVRNVLSRESSNVWR